MSALDPPEAPLCTHCNEASCVLVVAQKDAADVLAKVKGVVGYKDGTLIFSARSVEQEKIAEKVCNFMKDNNIWYGYFPCSQRHSTSGDSVKKRKNTQGQQVVPDNSQIWIKYERETWGEPQALTELRRKINNRKELQAALTELRRKIKSRKELKSANGTGASIQTK